MKVKQLIYTSWKNGSSTKKGFMVYSQSQGISEEDVTAITKNMRYVTLSSLPYSPTWEQIESMFPRNDAFFQLPSGKWCMAQSSYLGKDYSGRLGNYIIHAYIADTKPAFDTLSLIYSDAYRRQLTEAELNAESNPPALPEVEIEAVDTSSDVAELKGFFADPDKQDKLKYLVSAVTRATKNNESVYLYDDNANLKYWYKALGYCLSKASLDKLTYATYACAFIPGVTVQSVKPGGVFNYRQQLLNGALVYDFKDNAINKNVAVGGFINKIVEKFAIDPLGVGQFVSEVEKYADEAGGDLDYAIELSSFYNGKYELFNNGQSLTRVFNSVVNSGRITKQALASIVARIILNNPEFTISQYFDLFKFVCDYADKNTYFAVVKSYVKDAFNTQVAIANYDNALNNIIKGAPFDWASFIAYVDINGGKNAFYQNNEVSSFAVYALLTTMVAYGKEPDLKNNLIAEYTTALMQLPDLSLFKLFLKRLDEKGILNGVIEVAIDSDIDGNGLLCTREYQRQLAIVDCIPIEKISAMVLVWMLNRNKDDQTFITAFETFLSRHANLYDYIKKHNANDQEVQKFLESIASRQFLASVPTEQSLQDFYNRYFKTSDKMRQDFIVGLEKYAGAPARDAKLKTGTLLDWYVHLSTYYDQKGLDCQELFKVETAIKLSVFGGDFKTFKTVYDNNAVAINKFVNIYFDKYQKYPNAYYEVLSVGSNFTIISEANYKTSAFLNELFNTQITNIYGQETLVVLANYYLAEIFNVFKILAIKERDDKYARAYLNNVLLPISVIVCKGFKNNDNFTNTILEQLKKLDENGFVRVIPILVGAVVNTPGAGGVFKVILDTYFERFKKKQLQLLYDKIHHDVSISIDGRVKAYFEDKIANAKQGLFDKLFGKKDKETDGNQPNDKNPQEKNKK